MTRDLRRTFDESATQYQSARPDYPEQLIEDLVALAQLRPGARLLEIGCGPGKATLPLAGRGYPITALELGPELADQARNNLRQHRNVEIVTTAFEDWSPPAGAGYDLVYAATSWHWLDAGTRWAKTAGLLGPDGHLAVFGAGHAFPPGFDPFFTEIQSVYDEIGAGLDSWPPPPPDELPDPTGDFEASGHFAVDAVRRYVWAQQYDADSYIRLLNTFSGHIAMDQRQRERLFTAVRAKLAERPDGLLTRHWVATLVVAHPLLG